ncbi:MAG: hypothetical protein AAB364_00560 [Patescibacteria group bacterium]
MSNFWPVAYAQAVKGLPVLDKVVDKIAKPIITLLGAVAFVTFLYGVYEMLSEQTNEEARKKGAQHVLWGVIGLFIMISAIGILNLVCATINCR